jgi:hypothetical protein
MCVCVCVCGGKAAFRLESLRKADRAAMGCEAGNW